MTMQPDPSLIFERFVEGPANRVAAAAARRVAEAPGRSYNPLVVTGPAGAGKTHLLGAIGRLVRERDGEMLVHYETAASLIDRVSEAVAAGGIDDLRAALIGVDLLLFDGLDDLTGATRTQLELTGVVDALLARGAQLVVAAIRPPEELDAFDRRLAERLAGGLAVEVALPDLPTRAAILDFRLAERGLSLDSGMVAALAGLPLEGVRQLDAALDRLLATADLEDREPTLDDVRALAVNPAAAAEESEFEEFLSDISTAVAVVVETAPWRRRLAEAILRWEGEGVRTRRLEAALDADSAPDVDALLADFGRDVGRLRRIARDLPPGSLTDPLLLRDPDRLEEAERLLAEAGPLRRGAAPDPVRAMRPARAVDRWFLDGERIAWDWQGLDDRLVEEQR